MYENIVRPFHILLLVISAFGVFVHGDGDAELHYLVKVVDGMLYVLRRRAEIRICFFI